MPKLVDGEADEGDIAGIDDLDAAVSDLTGDYRTRAPGWAGDNYATTGLAREVGDGQPGISAGGEQQRIAGLQRGNPLPVVGGVGAENPPRSFRRTKIPRRHSTRILRRHHPLSEIETESPDRQDDKEDFAYPVQSLAAAASLIPVSPHEPDPVSRF